MLNVVINIMFQFQYFMLLVCDFISAVNDCFFISLTLNDLAGPPFVFPYLVFLWERLWIAMPTNPLYTGWFFP